MATIQDVAKHAGVGVATVSRVLNGKGYVKEATRECVNRAIKELNYTPNEVARNLFYKKTGIVAIIVPQISHPFFAQFVDEAMTELTKHDYKAMVCHTWDESHYELQYLEMLKQYRVDGIIFGAHSLDLEHYQNVNRPIVALDRILGENIPCVNADHIQGGRLAAKALIDSGCKKVIQFMGKNTSSMPAFKRHDVFEEEIRAAGVECINIETEFNGFHYDYFQEITEKIFEEHPGIDGAFGTDIIAMNMLRRAVSIGKKVPDDFKIVAYDGTGVVGLSTMSITTIVQPIDLLAKESVRLMMDLIQGKQIENMEVKFPVSLRKGNTTC